MPSHSGVEYSQEGAFVRGQIPEMRYTSGLSTPEMAVRA